MCVQSIGPALRRQNVCPTTLFLMAAVVLCRAGEGGLKRPDSESGHLVHVMPKSRMCGALLLISLRAFMFWKGTTLP